MTLLVASVARKFSRAAEVYDANAASQRCIAHSLAEQIRVQAKDQRLLDIGCGTGFLTREVLLRFPNLKIDALDLSPAMIDAAKLWLDENADRVNWIVADARKFCPAAEAYDLIVSSSAFQWMQPFADAAANVWKMLRWGGRLYCAVTIAGTFNELHQLRNIIAPDKPSHVTLPTTADIVQILSARGFTITHSSEESFQESYADAAAFLRTLRLLGFTGRNESGKHHPLTRGELNRLAEEYQRRYCTESGVAATLRTCYLCAEKLAAEK